MSAPATRWGRAAIGVGGQVLDSGTNLATAYLASVVLEPREFGAFVLSFAVVTTTLGVSRGVVGSTLLLHLPSVSGDERRRLVRSALGFTVTACVAPAVVLVVVLGAVYPVLWWFVPGVAAALLQDVGRHVLLADGRFAASFALDVAWAVTQGAVIGVGSLATGGVPLDLLPTAWGAGAVAGLLLFGALHPFGVAPPGVWWAATRDVTGWFTAWSALRQAEGHAVLLLLGVLPGAQDVGGFRVAQLLAFQPAVLALSALDPLLAPAVVRARVGPEELARVWRRLVLAVTPILGGLLLVALLHDPLVELVFPRYADYADLVVPVALASAFFTLSAVPTTVRRGLRHGPAIVTGQVTRTVTSVAAAAVGAMVAGPPGVAWALVGASALSWLQNHLAACRAVAVTTGWTARGSRAGGAWFRPVRREASLVAQPRAGRSVLPYESTE